MNSVKSAIRFVSIVSGVLWLSGCTLDSVNLRFNHDRSGAIAFTGSNRKDLGWQAKEIPADLATRIKSCGVESTPIQDSEKLQIDARLKFADPPALNSLLTCLPTDWITKEVRMVVDESLLSTTYTATIWLDVPRFLKGRGVMEEFAPSGGMGPGSYRAPPYAFLPLSLEVDMPANVTGIETDIKVRNYRVESSASGNLAAIRLTVPLPLDDKNPADLEVLNRLNQGQDAKVPIDHYKVVIHAAKSKFEFGSIGMVISLLALLFGSGLLIPLGRWLRSRNSPPAGPDQTP